MMAIFKHHRTLLVAIPALFVATFAMTPTPLAAEDICGVLRFDHMDGSNKVYKGVKNGCARIVMSENGRVVAISGTYVVPGRYYVLKPGQGFNCNC